MRRSSRSMPAALRRDDAQLALLAYGAAPHDEGPDATIRAAASVSHDLDATDVSRNALCSDGYGLKPARRMQSA